MDTFLQISIVGVIASLIIEAINKYAQPGSGGAKIITLTVSTILGSIFILFSGADWWQTMLGILGAASAVYAWFLKK